MKTQDIQLDKIMLINWITRLQDITTIEKIKKIQSKVEQSYETPQWQKEQLDVALEKHKNGTSKYVDWEIAKKELFSKFNIK